jgi:hypothetical protein
MSCSVIHHRHEHKVLEMGSTRRPRVVPGGLVPSIPQLILGLKALLNTQGLTLAEHQKLITMPAANWRQTLPQDSLTIHRTATTTTQLTRGDEASNPTTLRSLWIRKPVPARARPKPPPPSGESNCRPATADRSPSTSSPGGQGRPHYAPWPSSPLSPYFPAD